MAQEQELLRVEIQGEDEQLVACIKYALGLEGGGGVVFDLNGASGVFAGSGFLLVTAMVIVFMGVKVKAA